MATTHWLRALGAPLAASWLMLAAPAAAQDDYETVEAREQFNLGVKAMEAGDCAAAIPHFEQAYGFHEHYQIAGNLGACQLELGRYAEAAEHLSLALEQHERDGSPADAREALEQMRDEAMRHVGVLRVSLSGQRSSDVRLTLDGAPIDPDTSVFVAAGEHRLEAHARDASAEPVSATLAAGDKLTVAMTLVARRAAPPASTAIDAASGDEGVDALPIAMWSSYGVALVATGVGIGFLAAGIAEQDEADARRDALRREGDCMARCPELVQRYAAADTNYNTAGVLFGVGAAAAVAGTILLIIDAVDDEPEVAVVPTFSVTEAGIGVKGKF